MKTLIKAKAEPGIWMEDAPLPAVGHNDVLVKIKKTAICGTDIHIYNWDEWAQATIPVPMIVGHAFVGEIAEVVMEVSGLQVGDRVSGEGHVTCGHCRNCRAGRRHLCRNTIGVGVDRPGCFAEYLAIPAVNAFPLAAEIGDDIAAILDPLGNATHTALSFDLVGEDVLITGAGPIGIMAAAVCRHVGARFVVVTDDNDYRLALGMVEGFDVGLEMSGNRQAFSAMLDAMNHGGRVAILGIMPGEAAVDWMQIVFKGLTLKGIYGREMFETWYKMSTMLQSGLDISPILTHHFAIDDFQAGFDVMRSGQSGKVILDWD